MKYYAIIVAGGKGSRMKSAVPKQFLLLAGKPILMYSIENFFKAIPAIEIIVVLPKEEMDRWKKLCRSFSFKISHKTVEGGETRFHSVKNGLKEMKANGIVAIHDGVRPLTSVSLIKRCFVKAQKIGNAVPNVSINESLRKIKGKKNKIVDRNAIVAIQTPQCFRVKTLMEAYKAKYSEDFTDDASVFEHYGNKIHLIEGERKNIKITTTQDLALAETLIKQK
jgi:2-C-methyl-D-erythritol 4-phosphate cytidylyltransferase